MLLERGTLWWAALWQGWVKTGNYCEALQWGVAAGSASAFCETLATGKKFGDYMTKPSISFVRNVKKGCIFDENFGVVAKRKHCSWQKATG